MEKNIRIADKTLKQLMIEAQVADDRLVDAIESDAPEAEYKALNHDANLKIKRVRRRLATIKTGVVRWLDTQTLGYSGCVRIEGLDRSFEIASYDVSDAKSTEYQFKGEVVNLEVVYNGPYSHMYVVNVNFKGGLK